MKKSDWIILIIVIILIVAIGIWAFTSEEAKKSKSGRLQAITDKIDDIKKQIEEERQSLKLTNEMKAFVDKKINQWLWAVNGAFAAIIGSTYAAFFFTGNDWINSLFMTTGIVSSMGIVSAVFVSKEINLTTLIKFAHNRVRSIVLKKYGYDPSLAANLQQSIASKEKELLDLNEQLVTVNVTQL